jgi:hypothetical protein
VKFKTEVALRKEALCRIVCHNLCYQIAAIYALGITPVFWQDEDGERPDVLPMVRPG